MLFKTLTPHARRAILASTVAFSALVSNPLLPSGLGDGASTLGAAFAKGYHGGRQDGVHGHHGKGVDNHGKHKGKNSSNIPDSTDDDDDADDDNSPGDDDPANHDANDDHGGDQDSPDDSSSD